MLPTPSTSHVNLDRIYEPAEDSFLLLDTLSSPSETHFLRKRLGYPIHAKPQLDSTPSPLIVEVGTGSGVVLAFVTAHAQTIFGRTDLITLGTDINRFACEAAAVTVRKASEVGCSTSGNSLDVLFADLSSPLRNGIVDVLIFNPPYVPTPEIPSNVAVAGESVNGPSSILEDSFENDSYLLSLSYTGGIDGMEVTSKLLDEIPVLLSSTRGTAYLLLCQQNKPEEVMHRIRRWGSTWYVEVVGQSGKSAGWEKLQIIRIWRV
ncbi:S-adenosylmethionine-dependent methyltransferase [Toensbergia leucococca]|nr:S-adenosylmethionine-dependent methyltransferase [Toensbergia leucococca]